MLMRARVSRWVFPLIATALSACGSSEDHPDPILLSGGDTGTSVAASVNQEIRVTLGTIGPGQYEDPTVSAPCVRFLDMSFPREQNPGGPIQLFRFDTVSTGTATISIPHSPEGDPFQLTVTVR